MAKPGRPSDFTEAVALEIAALSSEGMSLASICERDGMPTIRTAIRWRHAHPEFDEMLMRAHIAKADRFFEETISIADEPVLDQAAATRNRLRVQARQYACARLNPSKYADRIGLGAAPGLAPLVQGRMSDLSNSQQIATARMIAHALARGLQAVQAAQAQRTEALTYDPSDEADT